MRRLRTVLLPLAAAALLALTGAASAGASAPADVRSDTATTAHSVPDTGAALAAYWTPERMRDAIPLDRLSDRPDPGARSAGPTGRPGSTPAARPAAAAPRSILVNESAAVGKVFFRDPSDGLNYVCSASALNSDSKQLLITAGHCVHEGRGGTWMQNWTYVPRYRSGARPLGTFAAKQFRAFNSWMSDSDLNRDVAMVTTWPLNGNKVVNVTGGHGLSWNYSRNQAVTVLGYPGNNAGGEIQWWCQGTTQQVSVFDGKIQIKCNFGGGSSGGPWLREYNDANGLGAVNGVTSTVNSDGWNKSSYFDDAVKGMLDAQGGVT
ncbi:trypsin-like peptidase domain-containing protein [Streptomyces sp. NPDC089919]|uniref:trypsin-like serine peptidase n=1 Tax=Streptomyces sp. NPDC089919 TaxID=3155188 RepID=UPI00341A5536